MGVVAGISALGTLTDDVERRHRQIEVIAANEFRHFLIEEGDEQRGDMGAVDIGIGHDDDAFIPQVFFAVFGAGAAAERLDEIGDLLVGGELFAAGAADVQNLAAQGQDGLIGAVARLLGRAARRVTLDDEKFRIFRRVLGAVRQLAGQAQLAHGGLAVDFLFLAAAQALFGALDHPVEQLVRFARIAGEIMVEGIAQRVFNDALGLDGGELVLGLADEFRLADEDREHAGGRDHHVVGGDVLGALVLRQISVIFEALGERDAETRSCVPPSGVGMVLQ